MLTIDIVSDVVCPWCYIGKRRLEAALADLRQARPDLPVAIRWLPYFLNPDTPPQGEPYRPFLEAKFGGPEKLAETWARLREAGNSVGINFAFERIEVRANTLAAHRLIHHMQRTLPQATKDLVEGLFMISFVEPRNLGDHEVLARIADAAGWDYQSALDFLAGDGEEEQVLALAERVQQMGVTSVPFFIFGGRLGVSGAQSPEILRQAMDQAIAGAAAND
ncbi:DsbA family oxidoreductase [Oryzomicrobium sp.]|uniref:DsbA family oxidoreductase n=1 Tax=Oryzomicrobium sp. TaxID=1911578 RepID=UPI0025D9FEF5|nr:DsbA family oxidoreductase [Oryzomicrobium sp.]MCE1244269.1 DsbA family oxidoreductase [Oryzomicrobium sp.]